MKKRNKLIVAASALALAVGVGAFVFNASSHERGRAWSRASCMTWDGATIMRAWHDGCGVESSTAADMDIGYELLDNQDLITRR